MLAERKIYVESIRSVHNPFVKYLMKLKNKKFRDREGKFVVEGVRFIEEALGTRWPVICVIYSPGLLKSERGTGLLTASRAAGIKTVLVEESIMALLSDTETPQGVLALCGMSNSSGPGGVAGNPRGLEAMGRDLLVIVDGVGDPGNLGVIIRSADAFGIGGAVLLKGTVDLFNGKALRSTMGSVFRLPVAHNVTPGELRLFLAGGKASLLVGAPAGGAPLTGIDLKRPLALVIGGEAAGPSAEVLSMPHEKVTIPMPGGAESLNVAVAASIMMYEVVRQREFIFSHRA